MLPLFTQNSSRQMNNHVDDGKTMSSEEEPCEIFNQFFSNIVPNLNIPKPKTSPMASENLGPIMSVIKSFDKHPSIVKIKTNPAGIYLLKVNDRKARIRSEMGL